VATVGEECDDGNNDSSDGCDGSCHVARCGNGVVTGGEACDDGNFVNGDGCSVCTVDFGARCAATTPSDCVVAGAPFTLRSAANLEITELVPDGQLQLSSLGQGLIEVPSVDGGSTTVSLALAGDPARRVICPIGGGAGIGGA
jgi:cysteine-rich repeat protein